VRFFLFPLPFFNSTNPFFSHSGFEREDTWGYRSLEPNRCCIASIALVLLKTGIVHPPLEHASPSSDSAESDENGGVQVNPVQLATAQKLLLFWRKPAVRFSFSPFSAFEH
jgi:hypothetical protein